MTKLFKTGLIAATLLWGAAAPVSALTIFSATSSYSAGTFGATQTASVSKSLYTSWGSGDVSLGTGITNVADARFGYDAYLNTLGYAGLALSASASVAPIKVNYNATGRTDATELAPNQIRINSFYDDGSGATFTLAAPEISASVTAQFGFANNFFGRACFVGCESWGGENQANLGRANVNTTLLGVSSATGGTFTLLGQNYVTGSLVNIGNYGSIAVKGATGITTPTASGTTTDKIVDFGFDVGRMLADSALSGFPLEGSQSFGVGSIDYTLLSLDANLALTLSQAAKVGVTTKRTTSIFNADGSAAYVPLVTGRHYEATGGNYFGPNPNGVGTISGSCAVKFGSSVPKVSQTLGFIEKQCFRLITDYQTVHTLDNIGSAGVVIGDGVFDLSQLHLVTDTTHSLTFDHDVLLGASADLDIDALGVGFSLGYGDLSVHKNFDPLFSADPSFGFSRTIFNRSFRRDEHSYEYVPLSALAIIPPPPPPSPMPPPPPPLPPITVSVPEPASWSLMIGGFGIVGGAMRRRRRLAFA